MIMSETIIKTEGLSKRYGGITAVDKLFSGNPQGRGLRPARTERGRKDNYHADASGADRAIRGDERRSAVMIAPGIPFR